MPEMMPELRSTIAAISFREEDPKMVLTEKSRPRVNFLD
jgi:hypothetical protein